MSKWQNLLMSTVAGGDIYKKGDHYRQNDSAIKAYLLSERNSIQSQGTQGTICQKRGETASLIFKCGKVKNVKEGWGGDI